jgi:hypothetical protein
MLTTRGAISTNHMSQDSLQMGRQLYHKITNYELGIRNVTQWKNETRNGRVDTYGKRTGKCNGKDSVAL